MLLLHRTARLVVAVSFAATIASCTRAPSTPPPPTASLATTASTSIAPTTTATGSATSTPTATSTAPTKPSSSTPLPAPDTCATAQLTITVERGSGSAGHQFATLLFKNSSSTKCSLTGFPGVVLLRSKALLGQPASRSAKSVVTVPLAPAAVATTTLTNDSTCNAANSDAVQVIVPNRTEKVVLALTMRGCPLTVDPVAAG